MIIMIIRLELTQSVWSCCCCCCVLKLKLLFEVGGGCGQRKAGLGGKPKKGVCWPFELKLCEFAAVDGFSYSNFKRLEVSCAKMRMFSGTTSRMEQAKLQTTWQLNYARFRGCICSNDIRALCRNCNFICKWKWKWFFVVSCLAALQ